MLDATEGRLTRTGTLTVTEDRIYVDGFSGQGTTCRDVAALACVWAIGKLAAELQQLLQAPGGGISCIGRPDGLADLRALAEDIGTNAMNDAAWAFLLALPKGQRRHVFNDSKPAVQAAVLEFLRRAGNALGEQA